MRGADLGFAPSGARAARLDTQNRERLADSVAAIADALELDTPATGLEAALAQLRRQPAHPGLFALYHDMAVAASVSDAEKTAALLGRFIDLAKFPSPFQAVTTLRDEYLGADMATLYCRMIDDDQDFDIRLRPVSDTYVAQMRQRVDQALDLIANADPELAAELAIAGRQIVLAEGPAGGQAFGGAATFFLWGALVINPATNADRLTLAETLVHESGHALLFARAGAEPLTLNAPDEKFPSKLRHDPRPMEGIVHATYVLARMEYFTHRALASGAMDTTERAKAEAMGKQSRGYYEAGLETIRAHARLSDCGREIFEACIAAAG